MAQKRSTTKSLRNHNVRVKFVRTNRKRKQPKGRKKGENNEGLIIKIK